MLNTGKLVYQNFCKKTNGFFYEKSEMDFVKSLFDDLPEPKKVDQRTKIYSFFYICHKESGLNNGSSTNPKRLFKVDKRQNNFLSFLV